MYLYNVAKRDGTLMLLQWVPGREIEKHLHYYLTRYKPGLPYPNGKGVYPDWGFHIVAKRT